jgi:hypothetical protein
VTPDPALSGGATAPRVAGWRAALRRELASLLVLKVAALALLWWLFFSPEHRTPVDAAATGQRLGVGQGAPQRPAPATTGVQP